MVPVGASIKTGMMRALPTLLAFGVALLGVGIPAGQSAPALPGTLAYIQNDTAWVTRAAGDAVRKVPRSQGVWQVSLSPNGGTLLFFVTAGKGGVSRGYISRAPFTQSQALPAPLDQGHSSGVVWSPDGGTAFVSCAVHNRLQQYAFTPADGRLRKEPFSVDTASRGRKVTARFAGGSLLVYVAGSKQETVVASSSDPKPLLSALRSARHPNNVGSLEELRKEVDESERQSAFSPAALSPDGQALFFASNLGAPVGASGNTCYCFFVWNVAEKRLAALSGLGDLDGFRMPEMCSVSPDGTRLLFLTIAHGSAIWNRRYLHVVDLKTQKSRELLGRGYLEEDTNLVSGDPCWSPDSRYVASDVFSYRDDWRHNLLRKRKPEGGWAKPVSPDNWDFSPRDYAVLIFDAATGREVRRIPHATSPSWSR